MRRQHAFTLIELLVAVAVAAVLLTIGVPSFRDFILRQRLKSVQAQLVTDLQFARSEAAARNQFVRLHFQTNDAQTCYTMYTSPVANPRCSCLNGAGAACTLDTQHEVRTVSLPASDVVTVKVIEGQSAAMAYDHISGGLLSNPLDDRPLPLNAYQIDVALDEARTFRITVGNSGRVTVCSPSGTNLGVNAC